MSKWDSITADDLRTAARVARASGGHVMAGAAEAWELRAQVLDGQMTIESLLDG